MEPNGKKVCESKKIIISGGESMTQRTKHCESHSFSADEVLNFRASLLQWYDTSKRDLPWRIKVMYTTNILTKLSSFNASKK